MKEDACSKQGMFTLCVTEEDLNILLECLDSVWDCYDDTPFYDNNPDKERHRLNLLNLIKFILHK